MIWFKSTPTGGARKKAENPLFFTLQSCLNRQLLQYEATVTILRQKNYQLSRSVG